MSPLTWQILKNKNDIYFSLIEADVNLDSHLIYFQKKNKNKKKIYYFMK